MPPFIASGEKNAIPDGDSSLKKKKKKEKKKEQLASGGACFFHRAMGFQL